MKKKLSLVIAVSLSATYALTGCGSNSKSRGTTQRVKHLK